MKHLKFNKLFISGFCITLACVFSFSCVNEKDSCSHFSEPFVIHFDNPNAERIKISHFDPDKVWILFGGKTKSGLEVDLTSRETNELNPDFHKYISEHSKAYLDPVDSIIWVSSPYHKSAYYNIRLKRLKEFHKGPNGVVVPRDDAVYFINNKEGLCYWNRRNGTFRRVEDVPKERFKNAYLVGDDYLILGNKYTYDFGTSRCILGASWPDYKSFLQAPDYITTNDVAVFNNHDSLTVKKVGLPSMNIPKHARQMNRVRIYNDHVWQRVKGTLYSYSLEELTQKKFEFVIPEVYQESYFEVDESLVWLSSDHSRALDLESGVQYQAKGLKEGTFVKSIHRGCSIYLLYNDSLIVAPRHMALEYYDEFDANEFVEKKSKFNSIVDSLGIGRDSIKEVALRKYLFLDSLYSENENLDIDKNLNAIKTQAFKSVRFNPIEEMIEVCRDSLYPFGYRVQCYFQLFDHYGQNQKYEKASALNAQFRNWFGIENREGYFEHFALADSVNRYLYVIDSLDKSSLPNDSLFYFKARAIQIVNHTPWYCSGGCGGCNYTISRIELEKFVEKFPESELISDALYYILNITDASPMDWNPVYYEKLKKLIEKYPNSGLRKEMLFSQFLALADHMEYDETGMMEYYHEEYLELGEYLIKSYPEDLKSEWVKEYIKSYEQL